MPRVADYTIITDAWVVEDSDTTIEFNVPSTIDSGSRCILGFMLQQHSLDDVTVKLRINGELVWDWKYSDGKRAMFFQEVIKAGLVEPGKNVLGLTTSSSDLRFTQISDVVLWWQANI